MSLEDAKPVRQIDKVSWTTDTCVLTLTDKQIGLARLRARFKGCSVFFMQTNLSGDITIARVEANNFIHRMVSQPK